MQLRSCILLFSYQSSVKFLKNIFVVNQLKESYHISQCTIKFHAFKIL